MASGRNAASKMVEELAGKGYGSYSLLSVPRPLRSHGAYLRAPLDFRGAHSTHPVPIRRMAPLLVPQSRRLVDRNHCRVRAGGV